MSTLNTILNTSQYGVESSRPLTSQITAGVDAASSGQSHYAVDLDNDGAENPSHDQLPLKDCSNTPT